MSFKGIVNIVVDFTKAHSSEIKTAVKVTGVFLTAWESGRVSIKAYKVLDQLKQDPEFNEKKVYAKAWDVCKGVGPEIAAPVVLGLATSGGIIFDDRHMLQSQMATMALCEATRNELSRYKGAVVNALGENKERTDIVAKVAQEDTKRANKAIVLGSGDKLFIDAPNGRPFLCTEQKIEAAKNRVDAMLNAHKRPTANDLSEFLDLPPIDGGDYIFIGPEIRDDIDLDEANRQFFYDVVPIKLETTDELYKYDDVARVLYYERYTV